MTASEPRVSIIVPVYNGMRTLEDCLDSLCVLAPESPSHEILVVDNGSTDGSLQAITARPGITLVKEHQVRGPSAARNAGAREARGEILGFTDIDCIVTKRWLIEAIGAFDDPGVVGAGGRVEGVEPRNDIQAWMNSRKILDQERALAHPFLPYLQTANAFYRREDFLKIGGFDTDLLYGEDCDLSWRIQQATGGRLTYCSQALVYHDHRCSISGLYRQSIKNAMGGAWLARKWAGAFLPKHWKTSVWECWDILCALNRYATACLALSKNKKQFERRLDLFHRIARKHGMIRSAWQTGQWHQW